MIELFNAYGMVFLVTMTPLAELMGAIPLGVAMGLDFWPVWLVGVLENMVPVPFIILFIRRAFCWMRGRNERLEGLVLRLEQKRIGMHRCSISMSGYGSFLWDDLSIIMCSL